MFIYIYIFFIPHTLFFSVYENVIYAHANTYTHANEIQLHLIDLSVCF